MQCYARVKPCFTLKHLFEKAIFLFYMHNYGVVRLVRLRQPSIPIYIYIYADDTKHGIYHTQLFFWWAYTKNFIVNCRKTLVRGYPFQKFSAAQVGHRGGLEILRSILSGTHAYQILNFKKNWPIIRLIILNYYNTNFIWLNL
jgi:hypothetical protein